VNSGSSLPGHSSGTANFLFASPQQENVYRMLDESVGFGPAAAYRDACQLRSDNRYLTRTQLIGHLQREIDGCILDVIAPHEMRGAAGDGSRRKKIEEICRILELSPQSEPMRKWIDLKFHAIAHRKNLSIREFSAAFEVECDHYDAILHAVLKAFASAFRITIDRVNSLLREPNPTGRHVTSLLVGVPNHRTIFDQVSVWRMVSVAAIGSAAAPSEPEGHGSADRKYRIERAKKLDGNSRDRTHMNTLTDNVALIVIDVQYAFEDPTWGKRNNPQAEENIARMLFAWRKSDRPIFHVRHLSLTPGSIFANDAPGSQIKALVAPIGDEPIISKNVNSAFIGTTLEQQLRDRKITQLVIVGLTTDHCVSTTTRMAGNLGFEVFFINDGTATFGRIGPNGKCYSAEEMHEVNIASLHGEFAEVVSTDEILSKLAVTAA